MIMYSVVKELAAAAELTQILLSIRATLCTESVISVQGYDAHAASVFSVLQCSVVSNLSSLHSCSGGLQTGGFEPSGGG